MLHYKKTREIMEGDPAIQQNILSYKIYTVRSFPGDKLPA